MTTNEIIKLIDAGFTAEEIKGLAGFGISQDQAEKPAAGKDNPSTPEPDPAPAPTDAVKPAGEQTEEKPQYINDIEKSINQLFESVGKLSKAMAMPSIGDIQPLDVSDVISKFFKE